MNALRANHRGAYIVSETRKPFLALIMAARWPETERCFE